jgi:protein involved in polysaccharide export with SLBB domain
MLTSIVFVPLAESQAQEFDEEFLESLPEDVRADLLKKKTKQEELEEDRYRRPSSYIEKEDYRKQITDLKRQLDVLENKLEESDKEDLAERFGMKVFSLMQTTFMPFNEPNFNGNYKLDFGDVLEIQLVGQKSQTIITPIKRDGSISIPDIGKIYLSGLSLDNAVNTISRKYENSFTDVSVFTTLISIRDIQIIVSGNVFNPGPYTLNGNSTLFHALAVSGGPSDTGSFRQIELVRDNEIIETADLYDTFIHGKSNFSTRLRSGDLIFIRPVLNLVSISGAVKRPGTYELKEDENLSSAILFANEINNRADLSEISLIRLKDGLISKIAINDPLKFEAILSNDKDKIIVRNYPFRSVEINGAVKNPGKYLVNEGSGIFDLVTIAGGYTKNAYPFGGVLENLQTEKINEMAGEKLYESFIDELFENVFQSCRNS